ncbi:MAG: 16S rRNA (guanine(527)-N(7))-methyltransferase RsmG [Rubrobacteraceae bacterium]|jgi:16S rRNA (guanine527-N7)-methyltransferase
MTRELDQLWLQCNEWGLHLDESCLPSLGSYAEFLATYSLANVIGTQDIEHIILDHLLDSLSCLTVDQLGRAVSIVDVGTGGGLPGVPLAIARPELSVTLLEATEKKARFLEEMRTQLGLRNVRVVRVRAEELGRMPEYRDAFDLATARALATLSVVLEYCAPLVRLGGQIISMKAKLSEEELSAGIRASTQLGVRLREIHEVHYQPPLAQKERQLLVFDKVINTPSTFPRRVGLAKKRPLGSS